MASPFPFTAGQVLTAAQLNSIGDVETWTPSFSFGVTIGNGTVSGTYQRVNDLMVAQARFTLGSTSSVSTFVRADLPVNGNNSFDVAIGTSGFAVKSSTGTYWSFHGRPYDTAAVYLYGMVRDSSNDGIYLSTALTPVALGTGDQLYWQMVYRVA